jgi:hypothetical protein
MAGGWRGAGRGPGRIDEPTPSCGPLVWVVAAFLLRGFLAHLPFDAGWGMLKLG